ncbi:coiled-coil domain-containing protein 39 [Spea bombifrons]|uniref:coiled-coil domain-containing protein 39 n=1 Tax=Spea bombifrons TaxID=233779 RepID=UPI00234B740D|nr:coiled-coil domain-containing protein 39 [Spea bombifrons]
MSREVLAELNWADGFAIPVANSENKALEDEMLRKEKEKTSLSNQLKEFEDRIQAMAEHLKNVKQELNYTQSLCRAREKETESEEHFKALSEREIGRLKQEIQRLENELVSLREKKNNQENNIFKATQKLENLKRQLSWDQQALEAWLEESSRKDEDSVALQKYTQKDDGKIKELSLQIERMTMEANQKRKLLDNELTETITAQIELEKTAEDFRKAHSERQQLIQQWESTIDQMQKRDKEIDHCALLLAQVKQDLRSRESVIKEKMQFLKSEIDNNKEYEKKISSSERQAAKLRLDYQEQESLQNQLKDELDTLKVTVDRTATDLEIMRTQVTNLKKDVQNKQTRYSLAKEYNDGLSQKLKFVTESALSLEERALRMEEMLREHEGTLKEFEVQLKHIREMHFKKSQELHEVKSKEKNIMAEMNGGQVSLKNLNGELQKLDLHAVKQQGIIYNQDFQIQQLERRLSRLRGEVNTDEKHALEVKVSELTKAYEERKAALNLLNVQHKKLQGDVRNIKRELEKTGQQKGDLISKMEELKLYNTMSEKALKKIKTSKQELMVEDNILKLEIKRLRDMLYSKADDVFSLEKRRLQLHTAMKERTEEITIHKEMLKSEIRFMDQERQNISSELHDRLAKVDKMRKRFEILTIAMMPPEGEEEKSQAYYIIKAAQEKEELQRTGDDLDAKIRKAEKEIAALENTLHVINGCNNSYRKSFNKVTESSEEYEEKVQLEEQKKAAEEKYRYKRRQIRELQEDMQIMKNTFDNMIKEESSVQERVNEMLPHITQLNKETEDQKHKLDRVMKQCSKLVKEIRLAKKTKGETQEEQDIDVRDLREFNRSINKMLAQTMAQNPDLAGALRMYFQQSGLDTPTSSSTPGSSRGSSRSSVLSVRSTSSRSSTSSGPSPSVKVLDLDLPPASPSSSVSSARSMKTSARGASRNSLK